MGDVNECKRMVKRLGLAGRGCLCIYSKQLMVESCGHERICSRIATELTACRKWLYVSGSPIMV